MNGCVYKICISIASISIYPFSMHVSCIVGACIMYHEASGQRLLWRERFSNWGGSQRASFFLIHWPLFSMWHKRVTNPHIYFTFSFSQFSIIHWFQENIYDLSCCWLNWTQTNKMIFLFSWFHQGEGGKIVILTNTENIFSLLF